MNKHIIRTIHTKTTVSFSMAEVREKLGLPEGAVLFVMDGTTKIFIEQEDMLKYETSEHERQEEGASR